MSKTDSSKAEILLHNPITDAPGLVELPIRKTGRAPGPAGAGRHHPLTLGDYDGPVFLMSPPLGFSAKTSNPRRAMRQFQVLYNFVASRSIVSLVTPPGDADPIFPANLAVALSHLPDNDTVVISNSDSPARLGEMDLALRHFKEMGYKTYMPTAKFEGEADLKHLHSDIYIGGYGPRSEKQAYEQFEVQFDMRVIKVRGTDPALPYLHHRVFPLTTEKTLVCAELLTKTELAEIGKHTEIIPVSRAHAVAGLCNSVRLGGLVLNASQLNDCRPRSEAYRLELDKNRRLEDLCAASGLEVAFFNLSEFLKAGAMLSSLIMHLNRQSYRFRLL